jgi:hypothetical protein
LGQSKANTRQRHALDPAAVAEAQLHGPGGARRRIDWKNSRCTRSIPPCANVGQHYVHAHDPLERGVGRLHHMPHIGKRRANLFRIVVKIG